MDASYAMKEFMEGYIINHDSKREIGQYTIVYDYTNRRHLIWLGDHWQKVNQETKEV